MNSYYLNKLEYNKILEILQNDQHINIIKVICKKTNLYKIQKYT